MRVVSIDPAAGGKIGYAVWESTRLQFAGVTSAASMRADVPVWLSGIDEVVIEKMQTYGRNQRVDPNDLIAVALVAGELAGLARAVSRAKVVYYTPSEWKGTLPKEISNERSFKALNNVERAMIEMPKSKKARTDVLDAIGIGLYHLGRSRPS